MRFLILIFISFLFSNERFIQPCQSNCNTIFIQYGLKGDYNTTEDSYSAYTSKDGSFLGYNYNLLSIFKNRRGNSMAEMYKSQERPLDIDSYGLIPQRY